MKIPQEHFFGGLAIGPVCGLQESWSRDTCQRPEPVSRAKASKPPGTRYKWWETQKEKRRIGDLSGEARFYSLPFRVHRKCVPLAVGQGRLVLGFRKGAFSKQRAVPLTGVGWDWVGNVPKAPPERGDFPVKTLCEPGVEGSEESGNVQEPTRLLRPLCKPPSSVPRAVGQA